MWTPLASATTRPGEPLLSMTPTLAAEPRLSMTPTLTADPRRSMTPTLRCAEPRPWLTPKLKAADPRPSMDPDHRWYQDEPFCMPAGSVESLSSVPRILPAGLHGRCEARGVLAKGTFAVVLHLRENSNGKSFALKAVEKKPLALRGMLPQVQREIHVHSKIATECPECVKVHKAFEDEEYFYMLMELHGRGSLSRITGGRVSEPQAASWTEQVARALLFLHERGIIHRDLKLDNLLMATDGSIKLTDFGWCAYEDDKPTDMCGTLEFAPPEVTNKIPQTHKVDSWALGMLLARIVLGEMPRGRGDMQRWADSLPQYASRQARQVLGKLWKQEPDERLAMHEFLAHPFCYICHI